MTAGLVVEGVRKRYGTGAWVLDGVDLTAAPGRLVALLGHNGSGKTTLFRGLAGILRFDAGVCRVNGADLLALPVHRKLAAGLAYLPQSVVPLVELTVREDLLAIAEILPLDQTEQQRRVDVLLDRLGLAPLAERSAGVLSGGESRRLAIAKTLLGRPHVLLLDEPFAGLDPRTVEDLGQLLRDLTSEGLAVVITDHQVHCTMALADEVYVLAGGRIAAHGTPAEVLADATARSTYFGGWFG
jgi:lipopolysaccharide export system ATP-binding protein